MLKEVWTIECGQVYLINNSGHTSLLFHKALKFDTKQQCVDFMKVVKGIDLKEYYPQEHLICEVEH